MVHKTQPPTPALSFKIKLKPNGQPLIGNSYITISAATTPVTSITLLLTWKIHPSFPATPRLSAKDQKHPQIQPTIKGNVTGGTAPNIS